MMRVTASGELCPGDQRSALARSARLFDIYIIYNIRLLANLTDQISTLEIAACVRVCVSQLVRSRTSK